jgi:hypothetical protein
MCPGRVTRVVDGEGVLVFIDITGRRLHRFDPNPDATRLMHSPRTLGASHGAGWRLCRRNELSDLTAGCKCQAAAQAGRQCREFRH